MAKKKEAEDSVQYSSIIIALIQLTHQMSIKSMAKPLMGYESLCYEKLCGFTQTYVTSLEHGLRGQNEGTSETEGGGS